MSIRDEPYHDENHQERDKVSLQTFGLGFSEQGIPHVVVFLRYLANLSPEHQQYWNSYIASGNILMCRQYYEASFKGEFWKNRSVRYAISKEIRLINKMTNEIYGANMFRETSEQEVPIGLTSFARPTANNFANFVSALDKLLADGINLKFFDGRIEREAEIVRSDGRIEISRLGSLKLLENWLKKEFKWPNQEEFIEVVIAPLRNVRSLRQKPAHHFIENDFSENYYDHRKRIFWDVFNSLSVIRRSLSKHPKADHIEIPNWLDGNEIDIF